MLGAEIDVQEEDPAFHEVALKQSMTLDPKELEMNSALKEGTDRVVNGPKDPF